MKPYLVGDLSELTHIGLFAGIGGDTLAAEWAGFQTVLLCEIDPFYQQVLRRHFPNVPIIGDVRDVTATTYSESTRITRRVREQINDARPSECGSDKQRGCSGVDGSMDGRTNHLTILTAGVPCQPASVAGKRRGKADDRWLWPEAIRVLSELQPTWAVFENPAGIGSLGELGGISEVGPNAYQTVGDTEAVELSNIIRDIEAHGYEVQSVLIPACAVGAPHRRDRIFIIAHTDVRGIRRYERQSAGERATARSCHSNNEQPLSDAQGVGLQRGIESNGDEGAQPVNKQFDGLRGASTYWSENWIEVATRVCRVDARPADRVHRLKALGNTIVPQQIYPIFNAIADIESGRF